MDSFFSLFDPSDGNQNKQYIKKKHKNEQDNVKKRNEGPKGRRRGKKSSGKNETLPEESSFLCEPDLSNEVLVKDVSYIENYFEFTKKDDESRTDDKKPKRRNSNRKTRKKKRSPQKDINNVTNKDAMKAESLNNQTSISKTTDDNIGKNVNNLYNADFKRNKRKEMSGVDDITDGESDKSCKENITYDNDVVYNVIDKLEKVNLKDDMYLAGDFDTKDLDSDFFYCSDGEEFMDDSTSEPDDSGDETYGSLPPEPRFGNVEYKLQLVSLCERRFQHLVTQLKWRLRSGGGSCVYVVGVRDCGALVGLRPRPLRSSLHSLTRMARALDATLTHVTARRVAPHRAVAEVYIRKLADPQQSVELRVAVMGANEAGKSTLIGVLTQGELDNGRGSARLNMFRHLHEVKSGRTSSLSHEILGFDAQGNVVNYGCSELMTAERIGERSAKLVSFLDLAGYSKYQRTTVHGLTGYSPHYAMVVISATAGITSITVEHIDLLLALDLPFFAVITKCEVASVQVQHIVNKMEGILAQANKKPLLITDENLARNCVAPQKLILDTIDSKAEEEQSELEEIPVFPVSCVKGIGLNSLHAYLLALQPPAVEVQPKPDDESCEFQIDEIFHVDDSTGPVVGGLLVKGELCEGDNLIMGPLESGSFVPVHVRSIYRNRVACARALRGQCASLGLGPGAPRPRAGMVLLTPRVPKGARPVYGGCEPNACVTRSQISDIVKNREHILSTENVKNRKNSKLKNKNLLQDIAKAEECLAKEINNIDANNIDINNIDDSIFKEEECICSDRVFLEDSNDPRGCIFFQATVHVLRHATAIYPGFQCTVHVANVRQTAIIEGIMSHNSLLRAGESASVLFRFVRCPEYLVRGRRLLFTAGLGTRAIGRITQIFPYIP
ncbi:hypothetical protein K1T71_000581 [Dendrolimus kikuchii]|uniref:Uncharacterized protein n=1 Tax=Dendrolimus kikuchii TaxID=765133 RepID=A0ACC1DJM6_9NEOP|nr:hypothetical protein K1T71_000581 [Dendrolimus kikuchii]